MLKKYSVLRDTVAALCAEAVDRTVARNYLIEQEPAVTARIAQRIEDVLSPIGGGSEYSGLNIDVEVFNVPDRGRRSLEHETGADLYFGIRVRSPHEHISKGFWTQAVWAHKLNSARAETLRAQASDMLSRTDKGSFVWIYDPDGVACLPASEVVVNERVAPRDLQSINMRNFFGQVIDCFSGDVDFAPDKIFDDRRYLPEFLASFRSMTAVLVDVKIAGE